MASKRLHQELRTDSASDSSSSTSWFLVNVVTTMKYVLTPYEKFVIGRSPDCSLVINEQYMSPYHCIIKYMNNQFIVYDNTTDTGTFVNGEKILKGKRNFVLLTHGDLIGFGEKQKFHLIFKLCMFSNNIKKTKFHNKQEYTVPEQGKINKKSLLKLHFNILKVEKKNLVLIKKTQNELSEFQKVIDTTLECASKLKETVIKQNGIIEDLTKKNSEYTLMIQQDNKDVLQESSIEMFKNQVNNLLEKYLRCPICLEVIFKTVTVNCSHAFCEFCINTWLNESRRCPVCRTEIKNLNNSLATDSYVTNLYELLGGTVKEQRDNLIKEQRVHFVEERKPQTARRQTSRRQTAIRQTAIRGRRRE